MSANLETHRPYARLSAIGENRTVLSPTGSFGSSYVGGRATANGCGGDGESLFGARVPHTSRPIQVVSVSEVRQRRAHIVKPVDGWASLCTEDGYGIIEPTKRCSRYKVREYCFRVARGTGGGGGRKGCVREPVLAALAPTEEAYTCRARRTFA